MSTEIKTRRGTLLEHQSFTGAVGEITVDTTLDSLRVHDGVKAGGHSVTLQAIALSLNTDKDNVIFSTDTTTAIPEFIHNTVNQRTYAVPSDAQGATILSVVDNALLVQGGGAYKLTNPARKSFDSVSEMQASNAYTVGDIVAVGPTAWEITSSRGIAVGGGLFAAATSDINLEVFGADRTGVNNSDTEINSAFNAAQLSGVKVVQPSGKFLLSGSTSVNIATSCDLSGCQFDVNGWSGQFIVNRGEAVVEYLAGSPVVNAIEASSRLGAGTTRFDGLTSSFRELEGSFIIMETDQDFYTYRSVVRKRREFNIVQNLGALSSAIKYSLVGVSITKISAVKIASSEMNVNGLSVLETDVTNIPDFGKIVVANDVTRLSINLTFLTDKNPQTANTVRFEANRCPYLRINGLYTDIPINNVGLSYGYSFSLYDCYDILCSNIKSDGYGWGVHGDGENQKLTIKDSTVSRVDQHRPFREFLKVIDTQIGHWGVNVVGIGDLLLDRVVFAQKQGPNFDHIITSRIDGGFIDGKLIARDLAISGDVASSYTPILESIVEDAQFIPATSPINPTFFTDVRIDGLSMPCIRSGIKLIASSGAGTQKLKFPRSITLRDFNSLEGDYNNASPAIRTLTIDATDYANDGQTLTDSRTGELTNKIVYDNVNADWFIFDGQNTDLKLEFHGSDIGSGVRYLRPNFEVKQYGRYELTDCRLSSVFSDSGIGESDISVFMNGGVINPNGTVADDSFNTLAKMYGAYLEVRGADLVYRDATQLSNISAFINNKDCNIIDKS